MNYLAHLYLSGDDQQIIVGNFIGDYVKGKDYTRYPEKIQTGIKLHRAIDTFTDTHKNCREAKHYFRNDFGLYSGIVVDFIYDHILARNWEVFSTSKLSVFANFIHVVLQSNVLFLPGRVQNFLPFLIQHKRLESYATKEGIMHSMNIMNRYSSFPAKGQTAIDIMSMNSTFFTENFMSFMDELIEFVETNYGIYPRKTIV